MLKRQVFFRVVIEKKLNKHVYLLLPRLITVSRAVVINIMRRTDMTCFLMLIQF